MIVLSFNNKDGTQYINAYENGTEKNTQARKEESNSGGNKDKNLTKIVLISMFAFFTSVCILACILLDLNTFLNTLKIFLDILAAFCTLFAHTQA